MNDLYTAEEAAKEVGVCKATIYVWVARGYLAPAETRGRYRMFRLADVLDAEAARKHKHRRKAA